MLMLMLMLYCALALTDTPKDHFWTQCLLLSLSSGVCRSNCLRFSRFGYRVKAGWRSKSSMLILEDLTQPYLLMKTMFAPPRVPISLSCSSEDFMKMLTELFFSPLCSSVCRRGRSSILLQGMRLCFSWTPTKRFLLFIQESRSGFLPLFRMNTLQLFLIKFPFCCSPQESSV